MKKRWMFCVLILGLLLSGCVRTAAGSLAGEKAKEDESGKTTGPTVHDSKYSKVQEDKPVLVNMIKNGEFKKPLSKVLPQENGNVNTQGSWIFYPNHGGNGNCTLEDGKAKVSPTNVDCPEYGIQLIQAPVVVEAGATYLIVFDAYAAKDRSITVKIGGIENRGWTAYSTEKVIRITTKRNTYKFEFTMNYATDRNARFEFWFATGQSPAPVWLTNVQMYKK
ncbi:MAG: carbohydrate binding domain-containing protein [Spirochaetales bacterium]|nr:carbohydrate binding domain-containing protein [Spirochaetales bacterium]